MASKSLSNPAASTTSRTRRLTDGHDRPGQRAFAVAVVCDRCRIGRPVRRLLPEVVAQTCFPSLRLCGLDRGKTAVPRMRDRATCLNGKWDESGLQLPQGT